MPADYDNLLPLCYEIEGLVCLLQLRRAEVPAEVFTLIKQKIEALDTHITRLSRPAAEPQPLPLPEPEPEVTPVSEPTPETEPEPKPEQEKTTDYEPEAKTAPRFQVKYFSVNDRYRFRRELFNFDDEEMEETLNALSQVSGIDEAIDYLSNDLCWDMEDETVRDFIDIIQARFE